MSLRVASKPITVPKGVEVTIHGQHLNIKGSKGTLTHDLPEAVSVVQEEDGTLRFSLRAEEQAAIALAGTMRALVNNSVQGVSEGFQRKLELRGVGFRAQTQGSVLNLTVGFSHPVKFTIPQGITIETPSQTEILVKGADKHMVGQVAANIRRVRSPDAYKGKGIRFAGEKITLKETKKK
ncbi:MAG: ribosomal protein [Gammaproteobacteria bacterium]|jgi:large subunit ribosomal protein L6|nr:ribosomal protein [Gammaproteobacteria bacterium]